MSKQGRTTDINLHELVDIKEVIIDPNLTKEMRMESFIQQIKDPCLFRFGDMVVACEFAQTETTFLDCVKQYIRMVDVLEQSGL
ncbi:MAG: DUF6870 family protein [Anaerotignum sp.]